jgi:hypothetical protein
MSTQTHVVTAFRHVPVPVMLCGLPSASRILRHSIVQRCVRLLVHTAIATHTNKLNAWRALT